MKIEAYKFSPTAPDVAPDILQGQSPEEFLKKKYVKGCIFGINDLLKEGA